MEENIARKGIHVSKHFYSFPILCAFFYFLLLFPFFFFFPFLNIFFIHFPTLFFNPMLKCRRNTLFFKILKHNTYEAWIINEITFKTIAFGKKSLYV